MFNSETIVFKEKNDCSCLPTSIEFESLKKQPFYLHINCLTVPNICEQMMALYHFANIELNLKQVKAISKIDCLIKFVLGARMQYMYIVKGYSSMLCKSARARKSYFVQYWFVDSTFSITIVQKIMHFMMLVALWPTVGWCVRKSLNQPGKWHWQTRKINYQVPTQRNGKFIWIWCGLGWNWKLTAILHRKWRTHLCWCRMSKI